MKMPEAKVETRNKVVTSDKVRVIFTKLGTKTITGRSPILVNKDGNVEAYIAKAKPAHEKKLKIVVTTEIKPVK